MFVLLQYLIFCFLPLALANQITVCKKFDFLSKATKNEQEYDLYIEENKNKSGEKGQQGEKGMNGIKGDKGYKGEKGEPEKVNETEINSLHFLIRDTNESFAEMFIQLHKNLSQLNEDLEAFKTCASNPCVHGNCSYTNRTYVCSCKTGYVGTNCDTEFDACESNPCVNGNCSYVNKIYNCSCNQRYIGRNCDIQFQTCNHIALKGFRHSGLYNVTIVGRIMEVYCDLSSKYGNWMVIQRRIDGEVDFDRNWTDYEQGFGNKTGSFWMGLENIHFISQSAPHELQVILEDWQGNTTYVNYEQFSVENSSSFYKLTVTGYLGIGGDGLNRNSGMRFSTKDRDNDDSNRKHCARDQMIGGWWFRSCSFVNPNGKFLERGGKGSSGIFWFDWQQNYLSLKSIVIKIRPTF